MKISVVFGVLFPFLCFQTVVAQDIYINEIMSKNKTVLQDEDGDFSDWIELFNSDDNKISLENYYLSDDKENLRKWKFPRVEIDAKGFLLIFASDKNRSDVNELHTNFKIASEGEALYLTNSTGRIIDSIPPAKLENDEAFGTVREGVPVFEVLNSPTPAGPNFFKDQVKFSVAPGFYEVPFYLKVKAFLSDSIYCNLSGNKPDINSVLVGDSLFLDFSNEIPNRLVNVKTSADDSELSYHGWKKPKTTVPKANVIRCASFENNQQLSDVFSATYFISSPGDERKFDLPVISLITEEKNLFDDSLGIYVPGNNFEEDDPEWTGNFFESGRKWERPIHIEYFEPTGDLAFAQNAGVRIHGGKTRQAAQKSLKFYGRTEYGKKYFKYDLIPDRANAEYRRFLLRTTMGSWGDQVVIKDAVSSQIVRDLNIETQGYQPAVVFLNGEYWGIHTIREKPDEWLPAMIYDLPSDSVSVVVNQDFESTSNHAFPDFQKLLKFIQQNDLSENANYQRVLDEIDIDSYMDYYIAETFLANQDWPGNNVRQWRYGKNGKWRYILFDTDAGMLDCDLNMFEHATLVDSSVTFPNPPNSTFLFRNLLKNENFKEQFVEKYRIALQTTLHPANTLQILNEAERLYSTEMGRHIQRWNYPDGMEDWQKDVNLNLHYFLSFRSCRVAEHIREFFDKPDFMVPCMETFAPQAENLPDDNFVIFPNPTKGGTYLFNNSGSDFEDDILVFNEIGQLVKEVSNLKIPSDTKMAIYFKNLDNGIYFLKSRTGNRLPVLKLVKL